MNLTLISDRLKAQVAALANRVYGASELEAAAANPERVTKPAVFVVWTGDAQLDQSPIPGQQARFREDFAVVLCVDNTTDKTGSVGVASVEALADDFKSALIGWAPSASHLPVAYAGSSHLRMDRFALFHRFDFAAIVPGGSIFTYRIPLRLQLLGGVSLASLYAAHVAAVEGVLGASTRLTSDYLLNRQAIAESTTRYQLVQVPAGVDVQSDGNATMTEVSVELTVLRHIAPADSERTYTETTIPTHLASFLSPSFWRGNGTLVRSVLEAPQLSLGADLTRE